MAGLEAGAQGCGKQGGQSLKPPPYLGRFAPSPTGPLHFGSLIAAVGSYLDARAHSGRWLLRMEDVDEPRCSQAHADEILRVLDAFGFARMQEFNSYLASTVHVAHAHRPRASRWADEPEAQAAMQRKVPANMTECFDVIERHYLGDGPWMLGEQYTVADGYLFTVAGWLKSDGVDIARFPKVHAHSQRMAARPAVQRALG